MEVVPKQRRHVSDTELEEDEDDSDFDNYIASEKTIHQPIKTNIEGELQLHTDGETDTVEINASNTENRNKETNTEQTIGRSNRESKQLKTGPSNVH